MVEARNALVTNAAVLRSDWSTHDARAAELTEVQVGRLGQFNNRLYAKTVKTVHAVTQGVNKIKLRLPDLDFLVTCRSNDSRVSAPHFEEVVHEHDGCDGER